MLEIKEAIVVEGRYDKNILSQVVDTLILETNGFRIFKDKETLSLIKLAARTRGLIIFTDADGAGLVIRNHLKSVLPKQQIKHAYTPDIFGKERRKKSPSGEGKLGVEGMSPDILIAALLRSGATVCNRQSPAEKTSLTLTKHDFFMLGLSGTEHSAQNRAHLLAQLNLPAHLSANALLEVINTCLSEAEFSALINTLPFPRI